jgi:hypothetical protein
MLYGSRRRNSTETPMLFILILLLALTLGGGAWGHSRFGYAGWSPAGILVVILLVMWFTGNIHA